MSGRWRALIAIASGASLAFALPPWGWWPLALVGTAGLAFSADAERWRSRAWAGGAFGLVWLSIGMCWMWFLSPPGYVVATLIFAGFHAAAAAIAPPGRWRVVASPALHTSAEAIRWVFPFGGVPLANPAIAMSDSPLLGIARVGGAILLAWVVFQVGALLATGAGSVTGTTAKPWDRLSIPWRIAAIAVVAVTVGSAVAPAGHDEGVPVRIAVVQGGGRQGTSALEVPTSQVFDVHLEATTRIPADDGVDLVVWPENGIGMRANTEFASHEWRSELAAQAARLDAPFVVGITEDIEFSNHPTDADSFVNAQVVVLPDGDIGDRYEKVRIVPFGEYVPLRGVLEALGVDLSLLPRDATPGRDPARLTVPLTADATVTVGVMISWEVFFSTRGLAAADSGTEILINPTNGSSYTGTVLQTQQVASSRLRAAETGRWVVQSSPTGFSAFVSPDGAVIDRTGVSEQAVITHDVPRRAGRTLFAATGQASWSIWFVALAAVTTVLGVRRRSAVSPDRR